MKKYIYAKDTDGYAVKTTQDNLSDDLIVILKEEYDQIVGTDERLTLSNRGGSRAGAGRKRLYENRKTITKQVNNNTVAKIKNYSKANNISENEAIDRLINAGYEHLKQA